MPECWQLHLQCNFGVCFCLRPISLKWEIEVSQFCRDSHTDVPSPVYWFRSQALVWSLKEKEKGQFMPLAMVLGDDTTLQAWSAIYLRIGNPSLPLTGFWYVSIIAFIWKIKRILMKIFHKCLYNQLSECKSFLEKIQSQSGFPVDKNPRTQTHI